MKSFLKKMNLKLCRSFTTKIPPCVFNPVTYSGPSFEKILKIRSENLAPCIKHHFKNPILINQGYMQWLYDHEGKRYLDMFGGIVTVSVGHCHPQVFTFVTFFFLFFTAT